MLSGRGDRGRHADTLLATPVDVYAAADGWRQLRRQYASQARELRQSGGCLRTYATPLIARAAVLRATPLLRHERRHARIRQYTR